MKIMIVPDIHLGLKSFGKDYPGKLNSRIQDQLYLMDFVYDKAKVNKIDKMILLGDIFDKEQPEAVLIPLFFEWLSACTDHFLVDIVMGNHDFRRVGDNIITILDTVPAARIKNCKFHKIIETEIFGDVSITYVPFSDKKQSGFDKTEDAVNDIVSKIKKEAKSNKAKHKLLFGHLAIEKSLIIGSEIRDEMNELFIPINAFSGFEYSWMGHIHNPQILSKKPFVAHLGSLDKTEFPEGDKYICLYDTSKNDFIDFKLPCRNLIDIAIVVPPEIKDTTEYVLNEMRQYDMAFLENAIVRVNISLSSLDALSVDKKALSKLLYDANIQHMAEFVEKKQIIAIAQNSGIDETTNPYKAVDAFLSTVNADDNFKNDVGVVCKDIIKEVLGSLS